MIYHLVLALVGWILVGHLGWVLYAAFSRRAINLELRDVTRSGGPGRYWYGVSISAVLFIIALGVALFSSVSLIGAAE